MLASPAMPRPRPALVVAAATGLALIVRLLLVGPYWGHEEEDWSNPLIVRGVIASSNRSARTSRLGGGKGKEIVLSTIPSRRSRWRQVVSIRG